MGSTLARAAGTLSGGKAHAGAFCRDAGREGEGNVIVGGHNPCPLFTVRFLAHYHMITSATYDQNGRCTRSHRNRFFIGLFQTRKTVLKPTKCEFYMSFFTKTEIGPKPLVSVQFFKVWIFYGGGYSDFALFVFVDFDVIFLWLFKAFQPSGGRKIRALGGKHGAKQGKNGLAQKIIMK